VEKNLDALRVLGLFPSPEERNLFFHIPEGARTYVQETLPENYVVFHPVSRWMFKTLPVPTMSKAIRTLQEKGKQVVLTASPDPVEMEMNRQIAEENPGVIDLSGQISLKELGAIIDGAQLLVTVDSVPLHLASALKKPTVVVFGPTCDHNWGPYRNPHARIVTMPISCRPCYQPGCGGSGRSDCLESLFPSKLIEAIHSFSEE
jgi:heptosyltransferase-3